MSTLPLTLTGVASTWYVPQALIEVKFAQGTLLGNPSTPKVLLIGPKVSSASATAEQVYGPDTLTSEADVVTYFGAGSPVHRMWLRFQQVCKTAPIYAIAPAESAGTNGTMTVVFATNATSNGRFDYTICGESFSVAVTNGDTPTIVGEAFEAEVNRRTWLPFTANNSSGTVTLTAKIKGTNANWCRHRGSLVNVSGMTATLAAATPVNGATDETYTNALAAILGEDYDYIVPGINPTGTSDGRFAALSTQVQTQKLPTTGIRQQVIGATADSLANATTYVTAYNKAENQILHQKNSEWEPMELAAHMAGVRYLLETGNDPGVSYDGYGLGADDLWAAPPAYATADRPSAVNINTALSVGLTPIASKGTKSYVVMSCTAAGADPRIRDTSKVTVAFRFADDLAARYASQWNRAKIADNQLDGAKPYPANVATPDRVKASTIVPLLRDYEDRGLLTDVANTILNTAVGIDPTVVTKMNARIPIKVASLFHQFGALVNEVSSG